MFTVKTGHRRRIRISDVASMEGIALMTIKTIEIIGRVDEHGHLEFDPPANLPPGDARIIIEIMDAEAEAADDALWQAQFTNSPETLEFLAREADEEEAAGLTDDFDPYNDPDAL